MFRRVLFAVLVSVLGYGASAQQAAPLAPVSAADLAFIDRVTWGVNESTVTEFQALGRDRWLDRQLHPGGPTDQLPAAAQTQIDAMRITTERTAELYRWGTMQAEAANQIQDPEQKKAAQGAINYVNADFARQAQTRSLLRDLYSPNQLREKMTWFWLNHFNVHIGKADTRAIGDYEELALRRNALGRFRNLLGATTTNPAMLRYLDNIANAKDHVNENYAREIMELHTMGVGSGYTQEDVQELARVLTGVGISYKLNEPSTRQNLNILSRRDYIRNGLFEFNPDRHDYRAKRLLGHTIDGPGFAEVEHALDILASHPATASYISRKIAMFFVSDTPPDMLVQRMAQTFKATDGDVAKVLLVMFNAPEFGGSLLARDKFKDPLQFVLSAIRLAYDSKVVLNTAPIQSWINRLGEGLYQHDTPDGYPLTAAGWNGPGQMAVRFEVARQIGANAAGMFKPATPGAAERPAFPQIQSAFYFNTIQPTLGASTLAALDQANSPQEWNTLFLSSPEFMHY